jgi:hypothetical protein
MVSMLTFYTTHHVLPQKFAAKGLPVLLFLYRHTPKSLFRVRIIYLLKNPIIQILGLPREDIAISIAKRGIYSLRSKFVLPNYALSFQLKFHI